MIAIWKDTIYTELDTGLTVLTYYITDGTNTIFNGRSFRKPDEVSIKINVSRICSDYLMNELSAFTAGNHTAPDAIKTFYLYNNDDELLNSYTFVYDWSYDDIVYSGTTNASHPINGHYTSGQKVITSTFNSSAYTNTVSVAGASSYCGKYALLYLNSYGGWDSFLIEGKSEKTDRYTSYTTTQFYNNTTNEFGKNRYVNEITSEWELHTGWLNDGQSANVVQNLLSSNKVYLQDIDNNRIIPVVITNTDAVYKQFKNEKMFVSYEIQIEESQSKERK